MPHHGGHRPKPDEAKKHLAMWLAVGGTMTVIVALWVALLPTQLKDFSLIGSGENAKWEAIRERSLDSRKKFEESLARLKHQLDSVDLTAQAPVSQRAVSPSEAAASVEKLKEKLNQPPAPPADQPAKP